MATGLRATEADISIAVLRIAAIQPNGLATFHRLKKEIPSYVKLNASDQAQSLTRPNEELWEQLVRNIKSHHKTSGNIICEGYAVHAPRKGYQITNAGRLYLKHKGY